MANTMIDGVLYNNVQYCHITSTNNLTEELNQWSRNNPSAVIIDLKFSTSEVTNDALIIYTF